MLTIHLNNELRRNYAINQVSNLPFDGTMEIIIKPFVKQRSSSQNAAQWAVRLKEISQGVWVNGQQFSADTWHMHLKREYLPEGNEEDFSRLVVRPDTYKKWVFLPNGERECIGSTTSLTTYGWSQYWTQIEAYFAQEHGLRFSEFVRQ